MTFIKYTLTTCVALGVGIFFGIHFRSPGGTDSTLSANEKPVHFDNFSAREQELAARERALHDQQAKLDELREQLVDDRKMVLLPRSVLSLISAPAINGGKLSPQFIDMAGLTAAQVNTINDILAEYVHKISSERSQGAMVTTNDPKVFEVVIPGFPAEGREIRASLQRDLRNAMPELAYSLFQSTAKNVLNNTFSDFGQYEERLHVEAVSGMGFIATIQSSDEQGTLKNMNTIQLSPEQLRGKLAALSIHSSLEGL